MIQTEWMEISKDKSRKTNKFQKGEEFNDSNGGMKIPKDKSQKTNKFQKGKNSMIQTEQ